MRTLFAILTVLMLPIAAADMESECQQAEPEVDTGDTPAGRYYVDNEACQPDCLFSIWVYQESNGQDGLQRCEDWDHESGCGYGNCNPDAIML